MHATVYSLVAGYEADPSGSDLRYTEHRDESGNRCSWSNMATEGDVEGPCPVGCITSGVIPNPYADDPHYDPDLPDPADPEPTLIRLTGPDGKQVVLPVPAGPDALVTVFVNDRMVAGINVTTGHLGVWPDAETWTPVATWPTKEVTTADTGLYDRLVAEYAELNAGSEYTPDGWGLDRDKRYLLVENNRRNSGYWLSSHDSPEAAAYYHDGQEHPADWTVVVLLDLHTGDRYQAVPSTSWLQIGSMPCDECGEQIPDDETSEINGHHRPSCSLHPGNVAPASVKPEGTR